MVGHKDFFIFFTPLISYKVNKADKVRTLVSGLRIGIMPSHPSSMMPKVPTYGVGKALVWYPKTILKTTVKSYRGATVKLVMSFHPFMWAPSGKLELLWVL